MRGERSEAFHEAFNLLCGEKLGTGAFRDVYACAILPDCVVKVEIRAESFCNITEWTTWKAVENTPASRWFAGCRWISPGGCVLIQERTRPPAPHEFLAKIPSYFTDLKHRNWGMAKSFNGDKEWLVCHDYGNNMIIEKGTNTRSLKRAIWNDGN